MENLTLRQKALRFWNTKSVRQQKALLKSLDFNKNFNDVDNSLSLVDRVYVEYRKQAAIAANQKAILVDKLKKAGYNPQQFNKPKHNYRVSY